MNHLKLITKREYLTKVRNKSFIIMTFLSPILMVALVAVIAYLSKLNADKVKVISILDESREFVDIFKDSENIKYHDLKDISLDSAKKLMDESDKNYGLLYIKKVNDLKNLGHNIKFYSDEAPSITISQMMESKLERKIKEMRLNELGISKQQLDDAFVDVDLGYENFEGEKSSEITNVIRLVFGMAIGYLLFMFIIIYGSSIMRSVIEEKTSRIIEVIVSSVKPIQLMLGKIFGSSLAGLTQFGIWIIVSGILFLVVQAILGIDLSQSNSMQQEAMQQMSPDDAQDMVIQFTQEFYKLPLLNIALAFLGYFLGGFLLYASLFAAVGAAVDNETDTQQFMMPIMIPLMLAIYVGFVTVIDDPHGTVAQVFSYIPFTSPVVMMMRIPFGVPVWQQLISLLILVATFFAVLWLAAKIYRVGILMYGKKPSYKELVKWLRY